MALTATTNTSANTALRYLSSNNAMASNSLGKLSSGSRIVKASDDAASLAVGTRIRADVTALRQGAVNAAQGSSLLQVADGGMAKVADILQRMKALAVQAQSGSVTDNERSFLDLEYQQLIEQIDDIAGQTKFNDSILLNGSSGKQIAAFGTTSVFNPVSADNTNGRGIRASLSGNVATAGNWQLSYEYSSGTSLGQFTLTNGTIADTVQFTHAANARVFEGNVNFQSIGLRLSFSNFDLSTDITAGTNSEISVSGDGTLSFQVGAASTDTITVDIGDVRASTLGLTGTDIRSSGQAAIAGNALDTAISSLNEARATLGSKMSRFEFAQANLATSIENLEAARSTLLDVDMAAEMTKFTSAQVLTQASVAMLAQANQMPQSLLRLLS